MKIMTTRLLCLALFLGAWPLWSATDAKGAAGDIKIATVDLKKVLGSYYKTKLAEARIKDEANGLQKDLQALMEDHDKALTEYKKAVDESSNQALSAEEREKRKKDAEGRLIKVNDLRQTVEQFKRTAANNIEEQQRLAQEKIFNEIRNVVNTLAKKLNYTMVLDASTPDSGRMSVVIFHNGESDLTGAVIEQLNANAPSDLPLGNEKNDKEKEQPKTGKSDKGDKSEKDNKK